MDSRLKWIFTRRSVRRYTDQPVSEEDLRALLEAAMAAPSANNRRPWHFVVVRERAALQEMSRALTYGRMLADAGLGVAVCGDPSVSDWWAVDCAAAAENLLLAAASLGLGGVWLGIHGRPERESAVQRALGIPDRIGVLCVLSIGHPAERQEPRTQFDPARVHAERWS